MVSNHFVNCPHFGQIPHIISYFCPNRKGVNALFSNFLQYAALFFTPRHFFSTYLSQNRRAPHHQLSRVLPRPPSPPFTTELHRKVASLPHRIHRNPFSIFQEMCYPASVYSVVKKKYNKKEIPPHLSVQIRVIRG